MTISSSDARNRMVMVSDGATTVANYDYNGRGERVHKTVAGVDTLFIFSHEGLLIAEADDTDGIQREYVYLNGERLAQVGVARPLRRSLGHITNHQLDSVMGSAYSILCCYLFDTHCWRMRKQSRADAS